VKPASTSYRSRLARRSAPVAGPILIIGAVLIVLRNFAFRDLLTVADVRTVYLPWYCYLGKSIAAGHIPTWNPFSMAGVPFVAAPESGWGYMPPMVLFTVLGCGTAIRWMIVIQPMLAGLGVYWFLRSERLSRVAATVGGLSLALLIAGSNLAVTIPFSGTLAWTAITLAAASRYLRAQTWSGRLGWAIPTALAWGQLAAAHPSLGLLMGTLALVAYLVAGGWSRVAAGERSRAETILAAGMLLAALLPVNLAYFLPRFALVGRTSLGLGYAGLQRLGEALAGLPPKPFQIGVATGFTWPLKLATSPGAHVAAISLVLIAASLWSSRLRPLAIAFGLFALTCYLLALRAVAGLVPDSIRSTRFIDVYLHNPYWFIFGMFLAVGILAGLGVQAWQEVNATRQRVVMVLPGVVVGWVLPLALGARPLSLIALAGGAVVGGAALVAGTRRPIAYAAVPVAVALELVVNGLVPRGRIPFQPQPPKLVPVASPRVRLARYVEPKTIAATLQREDGGRYLTFGPGNVYDRASNDMLLFGNETTDGYGSIQLLRYWSYVRAAQQASLEYHRTYFVRPTSQALDLLQVEWVVAPAAVPPESDWTSVTRQGGWALYRRRSFPPRASLLSAWTVVEGPEQARRLVADPRFDPSVEVVLEGSPGHRPVSHSGEAGMARFRWLDTASARVDVDARSPAIVLVRNAYDPNWRATVDGRPAPVLAADYVLQGIPVAPGHHTILLTYRDPSIGAGLAGSALSLLVLFGSSVALHGRRRSPARHEADDKSPR
jgi:membrane protein YfhO